MTNDEISKNQGSHVRAHFSYLSSNKKTEKEMKMKRRGN
jgi:hypothetical protein